MDVFQAMKAWSAIFSLRRECIQCSDCQGIQSLKDEDKAFPHALGCSQYGSELKRPWSALHDILDGYRG